VLAYTLYLASKADVLAFFSLQGDLKSHPHGVLGLRFKGVGASGSTKHLSNPE